MECHKGFERYSYSFHDFLQKVIQNGPFFSSSFQRSGKDVLLGHELNESHVQNI